MILVSEESKVYYYTDSKGKTHKIIPLKSTLSFPVIKEGEIEALKRELKELEELEKDE